MLKTIFKSIAVAVAVMIGITFFDMVISYPEMFSTTLKYQLKNDLKRGDELAIEYYQNTYVANGIELFDW